MTSSLDPGPGLGPFAITQWTDVIQARCMLVQLRSHMEVSSPSPSCRHFRHPRISPNPRSPSEERGPTNANKLDWPTLGRSTPQKTEFLLLLLSLALDDPFGKSADALPNERSAFSLSPGPSSAICRLGHVGSANVEVPRFTALLGNLGPLHLPTGTPQGRFSLPIASPSLYAVAIDC